MAYNKTAWKNREVEKPRTFKKVENPDGTITLVPAEGNIIEPGTPIIAENMNNIEQGIEDAHNEINEHLAEKATRDIAGHIKLSDIPVKSVNGKTGYVTLNNRDVGAVKSHYESFKALTLQNGWGGKLYYIKDDSGVVHLQSNLLYDGITTRNTVIATLPQGYRPQYAPNTVYLNVHGGRIRIGVDGDIIIDSETFGTRPNICESFYVGW